MSLGDSGRKRQWVSAELMPFSGDGITFSCGNVRVGLDACVAWLPSGPIGLRPQETRLLRFLYERVGRVVHADDITRELYDAAASESMRMRLKTLVSDLRRRLGPEMAEHLRTARGIGLILYAAKPVNHASILTASAGLPEGSERP